MTPRRTGAAILAGVVRIQAGKDSAPADQHQHRAAAPATREASTPGAGPAEGVAIDGETQGRARAGPGLRAWAGHGGIDEGLGLLQPDAPGAPEQLDRLDPSVVSQGGQNVVGKGVGHEEIGSRRPSRDGPILKSAITQP